jgi:hypothetical protein
MVAAIASGAAVATGVWAMGGGVAATASGWAMSGCGSRLITRLKSNSKVISVEGRR